MSNRANVETFNPESLAPAAPTYSHIARTPLYSTSTLITLAGQIGYDDSTQSTGSTLGEQCSIAYANVDKCLAAAGARKEDIVHVRHYVVDLQRGGQGQDPERAKRYVAWLGDLRPPATLLGVQALAQPHFLYEIDVVCVVHHEVQHQA